MSFQRRHRLSALDTVSTSVRQASGTIIYMSIRQVALLVYM